MSFDKALQVFVDIERKLDDQIDPISDRDALQALAVGLQHLTRAMKEQLETIELKVSSTR